MPIGDMKKNVKKSGDKEGNYRFGIGAQHKREPINPDKEKEEEERKGNEVVTRSFRIRNKYIDCVQNAVYSRKYLGGEIGFSQQDVIEEALELYKQQHQITSIPEEHKGKKL